MNVRFLVATASAALVGTAAPGLAASILIDDFTTKQAVFDRPGSENQHSEIAAAEALGAYREMLVETDGDVKFGTGEDVADTTLEADAVLTFSNKADVTGRTWLTYDGQDNAIDESVVTNALNVDLVRGGDESLNGFLFDIVNADARLYIEIRAWDQDDEFAVFSETIVAGGGNPFVPFAAFTEAVGSGTPSSIDWTNIGALQFFAESGECLDSSSALCGNNGLVTALDGTINRITVEVIPLPAPALLLLGGLGGLGALRLRKRKTT